MFSSKRILAFALRVNNATVHEFFMAFKHKSKTVAITQSKGGCREQAGWNTWRKVGGVIT